MYKDSNVAFTLARGGQRRLIQETEVIMGNVAGVLPIGDKAAPLQTTRMCPSNYRSLVWLQLRPRGHVARAACLPWPYAIYRPREYHIHWLKSNESPTPLAWFCRQYYRIMHGTWRDFYWAHLYDSSDPKHMFEAGELSREIAWGCERGTSLVSLS